MAVELKGTLKQLVESEKMASLGRLVAGVAHEIKTPVGNVFTAVTTLREKIKEITELFEQNKIKQSDFKEFLQDTDAGAKIAQTNIEQAAELIKNFKQVAVDQTSEAKGRNKSWLIKSLPTAEKLLIKPLKVKR